MIWFTSDWHFGHDKEFLWGPRGLPSMFANSQAIVGNHNSMVANDDDVYVLGDLMLGDNEYGLQMIKSMKGKLHIILGNHDTDTRIKLYEQLPNVVEITYAKVIKIGKQHYYLSHYPTICSNYDDKPYHNHMINLFGHTHQKGNFYWLDEYEENPFMYHVGVDSHGCCPVSAEQVSEDIHNKINELHKMHQAQEKLLEYEMEKQEAMDWFDKHPACGEEILD